MPLRFHGALKEATDSSCWFEEDNSSDNGGRNEWGRNLSHERTHWRLCGRGTFEEHLFEECLGN